MSDRPPESDSGPSADDLELRFLGPGDAGVLDRVDTEVFDEPIAPRWRDEFLADPRHHLVVALEGDLVVAFASGFHYVHPDKPPQMWINEVGVTPRLRRRGVASALVRRMVDHARELGCTEAWLLTEHDNIPARALYESMQGEEFAGGVVGFSFELTTKSEGPPAW